MVNDGASSEDDEYDVMSHIDIYTVDKDKKKAVIKVFPKVENVVLEMELDTGSAISVITFDQHQKHFSQMKLETKENQFPLPNPKLSVQSSTCLLDQHDGNDGR